MIKDSLRQKSVLLFLMNYRMYANSRSLPLKVVNQSSEGWVLANELWHTFNPYAFAYLARKERGSQGLLDPDNTIMLLLNQFKHLADLSEFNDLFFGDDVKKSIKQYAKFQINMKGFSVFELADATKKAAVILEKKGYLHLNHQFIESRSKHSTKGSLAHTVPFKGKSKLKKDSAYRIKRDEKSFKQLCAFFLKKYDSFDLFISDYVISMIKTSNIFYEFLKLFITKGLPTDGLYRNMYGWILAKAYPELFLEYCEKPKLAKAIIDASKKSGFFHGDLDIESLMRYSEFSGSISSMIRDKLQGDIPGKKWKPKTAGLLPIEKNAAGGI